MTMPGRKFNAGTQYRYGFNGKELDTDAGIVQYDYGFRIYNPALGRFLSVDPLINEFSWWSPYVYAGNTPTNTVDLDGLEVPPGKNKNKTEKAVEKALGTVDFSRALLKRDKYVSNIADYMRQGGDPTVNIKTFGLNSAKAGWNQLVGFAETAVNMTTPGGRQKILGESLIPTAKFFFEEWPGMTAEQKLNFLKTVASDPETYENLVASLTIGILTEKVFPNLKLPVPKELQPLQKEVRGIIEAKEAVAKGGKYAFGLKDEVVSFADNIGASHLMKDPNWKGSFSDIISNANNELHFTLNGIDETPMQMILNPTRSGINWEMHTLYNSPAFEKTIFHYRGNTYIGFDVLKIKP
jgi:RHS repeat-associated protein